MRNTIASLLESGRMWIEDGEYLAVDEDGITCAVWTVGDNEKAFQKALDEGYGPQEN